MNGQVIAAVFLGSHFPNVVGCGNHSGYGNGGHRVCQLLADIGVQVHTQVIAQHQLLTDHFGVCSCGQYACRQYAHQHTQG